jgi:hypothetical protein
MRQTIEEQLSVLLDGELPVEEEELLFQRLEQDTGYRETFGRYCLIGELIRGSEVDLATLRISAGVRELLAQEVVLSAAGRPPKFAWGIGKGLVGLGIAASVAVVALISLVSLDRDPVSSALPIAAQGGLSYTVPDVGRASTVIAPVRLTSYLVSHGEFSSAVSRRVMDSHVVKQMPETAAWTVQAGPENE